MARIFAFPTKSLLDLADLLPLGEDSTGLDKAATFANLLNSIQAQPSVRINDIEIVTTSNTYPALTVEDKYIICNSAGAISIDVSAGAPTGGLLVIQNLNTGAVTFTATSGRSVTLNQGDSVVLVYNGTEWVKIGGSKFIDIFTSSGSFTSPWAGSFKVTVVGGGGGAGGVDNEGQDYGTAGGGGGGAAIRQYALPSGQVCTVTRGGGGGAGGATGTPGGTGGTSSFTDGITAISATGGAGTVGSDSLGGQSSGGAGGIGSGGTLNIGGCAGTPSVADVKAISCGGSGGNSIFGGGGNGARTNGGGGGGRSYGGGGGGAATSGSSSYNGGAGAAGVVIVEY